MIIDDRELEGAAIRLSGTPEFSGLRSDVFFPFSEPGGIASLLRERRPLHEKLKVVHASSL